MRPATALSLAALAASIAGAGALGWALIHRIEHWEALPFAALAEGSVLLVAASVALAWRAARASPPDPVARRIVPVSSVVLAAWVLVWLETWSSPVQDLLAAVERAALSFWFF